jgi:CheY-like chemotaxis protein
VIRGSAEILQNPGLSEEKRARYVKAISETADRAALLTGQLLAFARRQPLRPERFDVAARIKGMQQIVSTTVGSPVLVEMDLAESGEIIEADPNQFETAVLNMVINAKDAMPSGGTLTLEVQLASEVPAVRGHAAAAGDFVAVSVKDNGTGIEPAVLTRIFEPFFTTKGVNKGTGLGLSQVYGFAKQSGGEVAAVSTVGQGSTFTLYLPRSDGSPTELGREVIPSEVPRLETRTILLVEDNETVGEFAVGLLTEMGQTVTWATHAEAALETLRERHADFDLVFSDVVMPGASGIDLAREIRDRWPDLPVVLTSGYSHVLAEEGSHGFALIQKPYSVKDLIGLLGNAHDPGPRNRAA